MKLSGSLSLMMYNTKSMTVESTLNIENLSTRRFYIVMSSRTAECLLDGQYVCVYSLGASVKYYQFLLKTGISFKLFSKV